MASVDRPKPGVTVNFTDARPAPRPRGARPGDQAQVVLYDTAGNKYVYNGVFMEERFDIGDSMYGGSEHTITIGLDYAQPRNAVYAERPPRTEVQEETTTKETDMKAYEVVVIRDKATKSANIHVRVEDTDAGVEQYLRPNGTKIQREMGNKMPLYSTMPDEIFIPLLRSAANEYH